MIDLGRWLGLAPDPEPEDPVTRALSFLPGDGATAPQPVQIPAGAPLIPSIPAGAPLIPSPPRRDDWAQSVPEPPVDWIPPDVQGNPQYPLDPRPPPTYNAEGIDITNRPLMPPRLGPAPLPDWESEEAPPSWSGPGDPRIRMFRDQPDRLEQRRYDPRMAGPIPTLGTAYGAASTVSAGPPVRDDWAAPAPTVAPRAPIQASAVPSPIYDPRIADEAPGARELPIQAPAVPQIPTVPGDVGGGQPYTAPSPGVAPPSIAAPTGLPGVGLPPSPYAPGQAESMAPAPSRFVPTPAAPTVTEQITAPIVRPIQAAAAAVPSILRPEQDPSLLEEEERARARRQGTITAAAAAPAQFYEDIAAPIVERFRPRRGIADVLPAISQAAEEGFRTPPPRTEADRLLQESVRAAGEPIVRPIQAAVTSTLESAGIDPATAYQAAQDVSGLLGPVGVGVGMVRRGASSVPGGPRARPPGAALDPAQVAAEAARGPVRGASLNRPISPESAQIPLHVRAATALTDDQAALRWAEDRLIAEAGGRRLPENAPARPSALRRRNPDSVSEQRIRDDLLPVVARAKRDGLLDELAQYLQDTHEKDVLAAFYQRGYDEAIEAGADAARAEAAGLARMAKRSSANPDLSWEAVNARLEGQANRLGPKAAAVDELAQGVWAHNRATLDRMLAGGRISAEQHRWLTEAYPHYVPTVPVSQLDPGGGRAAVGRGGGVSATRAGPGDVKAFEDVASGAERLNPIIASRDATIARERAAHRNEVFQAFARIYDDAMQAGGPSAAPSQGARRQRFAGEIEASGRVDGEPVTIRVPRPIAELIDTMGQMGTGTGPLALWRAAMSAVTTSITGRRAAFLPVNLARDFGDSLIRAGSEYGLRSIPEYLGLWMREAGNAAADLAVGAVRGRLQPTGRAEEYLRRGGGMGTLEGGWKAGQQWYDDVQQTGGVVVTNPSQMAKLMRDLATFRPVMAANERTELISRTAMMELAERRGAAPTEAMIAGRNASIDFQRAGTVIRMFNGAIPFLNATVQSGAQLARTVTAHPKSATATFATVVGLPTIAAEVYNRSDPTRAAAYDDVPQYVKDQGIVVMLPWAGSDTRGERPLYAWMPLGMGAPVAVAIREAMRQAPGLEPAAGRADLPADASDAERWLGVANQVFSVFSPVKGDTAAAAASSLIPPGVKQLVELGTNKNLYTGGQIASDLNDERASAASRAAADLANQAGRAIGSDLLQEVRPSQVEYLTRQLPAYGDVITGVSDIVAPSAAKQAEDRPIANVPVVGGIAARIVRDVGGADLERAQSEILSPTVREAIGEAGQRPSDVKPVPASISVEGEKVPLMRDEQVRYQERTNTYAERELAQTMRSPEWRQPQADREQLVTAAMTRARQRAAEEVLRGIPTSEQRRRTREAAATGSR